MISPHFIPAYSVCHPSTSSVSASADGDEAYVFLDDFGDETNTVPANGHINVAAYLESNGSYSPLLTTLKDGASDNTDDNYTPLPTPTPQEQTNNDVGSSGGGCNSGLSFMTLAALVMLMKRRCAK